jgi:hypothetical protein
MTPEYERAFRVVTVGSLPFDLLQTMIAEHRSAILGKDLL